MCFGVEGGVLKGYCGIGLKITILTTGGDTCTTHTLNTYLKTGVSLLRTMVHESMSWRSSINYQSETTWSARVCAQHNPYGGFLD